MQLCKELSKGKGPCIVMAALLTAFYIYALWQLLPAERNMFNILAALLGVTLIALWACILVCRKR